MQTKAARKHSDILRLHVRDRRLNALTLCPVEGHSVSQFFVVGAYVYFDGTGDAYSSNRSRYVVRMIAYGSMRPSKSVHITHP